MLARFLNSPEKIRKTKINKDNRVPDPLESFAKLPISSPSELPIKLVKYKIRQKVKNCYGVEFRPTIQQKISDCRIGKNKEQGNYIRFRLMKQAQTPQSLEPSSFRNTSRYSGNTTATGPVDSSSEFVPRNKLNPCSPDQPVIDRYLSATPKNTPPANTAINRVWKIRALIRRGFLMMFVKSR